MQCLFLRRGTRNILLNWRLKAKILRKRKLTIHAKLDTCRREVFDKVTKMMKAMFDKPVGINLKPWPNGLSSRRTFSTCVQLAFRLAKHLRWFQIRTQVRLHAGFFTVWPPNISWSQVNCICVKFTAFCHLRADLRIRLATIRKYVCKFWFRKLASTCESVWPGRNNRKNSRGQGWQRPTRQKQQDLLRTYYDKRAHVNIWNKAVMLSILNFTSSSKRGKLWTTRCQPFVQEGKEEFQKK